MTSGRESDVETLYCRGVTDRHVPAGTVGDTSVGTATGRLTGPQTDGPGPHVSRLRPEGHRGFCKDWRPNLLLLQLRLRDEV